MKKHLHLLFALVLLFIFANSNATHIAGTHVLGIDAQWKSNGNDTVEITVTVYMRCTDGGSSLSNTGIQISSDSCANAYSLVSGNPVLYSIDDVTPVCNDNLKLCTVAGGSGQSTPNIPLGVERNRFTYKIYLGGIYSNCCWYKIRWGLCCRSPNSTTGFAESDFVNEFWMNRCVINNSPEFTSSEMVMRCAGQDVRYNLGMIDAENDSLSYSLSQPLGGGNYFSPWSYTYPLTCLNGNNPNPNTNPPTGFNLDAVTGDIQFRPTQIQVSAIKVTVTEWRTIAGVVKVIGKTSKDMEITILQPYNKTPTISEPYSFNFCAEQENCFTITTDDLDTNDSTLLSSNSSLTIPGSTFDVITDTSLRSTGTFCWTPSANQARSKPYSFVVRVKDSHCPVYAEAYTTYSIYVKPKFDVSFSKIKHSCTTFDFIAVRNDTSSHYNKWEIIKGNITIDTFLNRDSLLNYKFKTTGIFFIKYLATNSNCTFVHYDTLVITNAASLNLIRTVDTSLCKGNAMILMVTPTNGQPPYNYKWYANGALLGTSQSLTILPTINSTYIVEAISSDTCKLNCVDTIKINIFPVNNISISAASNNLIYGQSTVLGSNGKNNFNWSGANIISNWNDSVLVKPTVTTTYTLICDNIYGCRDTGQITISVSNVGIKELRITDYELRVYPNPADNTLNVHYVPFNNFEYKIFNLLGQAILEGELTDDVAIIDIRSLSPGIYFIGVRNELRKFVKE